MKCAGAETFLLSYATTYEMMLLAPSSSIAGLEQQRGKKRSNGPPPHPTLPAVRQAILERIARPPPQRCPHCRKWMCSEKQDE